MIARRILATFKGILTANQPLGRWTTHNYTQTVLKIKYANEDNCGVSGNKIQKSHEDQLMYMMDTKPYTIEFICSVWYTQDNTVKRFCF